MQFLPTPPAFGVPVGVIPSEFRRDLLHYKTRVPGLLCGTVFKLIYLAVFIQYQLVTDRQMDGQTCDDSKYHAIIAVCR